METRSYVFSVITVLLLLLQEGMSQIPASGADVPLLTRLQWKMSMEQVQSALKDRKLQGKSDTTLVYEDTLLGGNTKMTLTFYEKISGLGSVSIDFKNPNGDLASSVLRLLKDRYGDADDTNTKEEKKLFFGTLKLQAMIWNRKDENIVLAQGFRDGGIVALNIRYNLLELKRE